VSDLLPAHAWYNYRHLSWVFGLGVGHAALVAYLWADLNCVATIEGITI
jgi:hypothetical protein